VDRADARPVDRRPIISLHLPRQDSGKLGGWLGFRIFGLGTSAADHQVTKQIGPSRGVGWAVFSEEGQEKNRFPPLWIGYAGGLSASTGQILCPLCSTRIAGVEYYSTGMPKIMTAANLSQFLRDA